MHNGRIFHQFESFLTNSRVMTHDLFLEIDLFRSSVIVKENIQTEI